MKSITILRIGYQNAIDTGNMSLPQELLALRSRFLIHHLDYLVFITVETE
jgi:hypothetical protein